jgi:hypothetical protein
MESNIAPLFVFDSSPHCRSVLCPLLDDAIVNGPLRPAAEDAIEVDVAALGPEAAAKAEKAAAKSPWFKQSPRWLTLAEADWPFALYPPFCVGGKCSAGLFLGRVRCGFETKYPKCPVEHTEDKYWWSRWQPRETGVSRETGEPIFQMEFVPCCGTRAEFLEEFSAKFTEYMPHIQSVRLAAQSKRKQEEHLKLTQDTTTNTSVTDYTAQIEVPREYAATCAYNAKHNCCVSVVGYKPKEEDRFLRAHGKRLEDERKTLVMQQVDVFYGLFGANRKSTAEHYNMQREDYEHILKHGTSLHGEWFENGQRIPRKGGEKHAAELPTGNMPCKVGDEEGGKPWGLVDAPFTSDEASAAAAVFPEMEHTIEPTDGCGGQFQGEANVGRVATALHGPTKLRRHSVIGVANHGKGIGDAMGYVLTKSIDEGVAHQRLILQGTRNLVLYLAQHHPAPKGDPATKTGFWAPRRYFYGFYRDELWAKTPQHYKPSAPKNMHSRSTTANADPRTTNVSLRTAFCSCPECVVPNCNYGACKIPSITGNQQVRAFKPVSTPKGATTQSQSLADFSATLKVGEFRAVNVASDQQGAEGSFWLAELLSETTQAEADYMYGGEEVKAGFLVVKARWLQYTRTDRSGARFYKALPEDRYLNTNTLARIAPATLAVPKDGKNLLQLHRDEFDRISNSTA